MSFEQAQQILAIAILGQRRGKFVQLGGVDPLLAEGYFFGAAHLQALALLQGGDEARRLQKAVVGAGIQPGVAAAHDFNIQVALFKIKTVDVGNFQFAAR